MKRISVDLNDEDYYGPGTPVFDEEAEKLKLSSGEKVIAMANQDEWDAVVTYYPHGYHYHWFICVDGNTSRTYVEPNKTIPLLYKGNLLYGTARCDEDYKRYIEIDAMAQYAFDSEGDLVYVIGNECIWDGIVLEKVNLTDKTEWHLELTKQFDTMCSLDMANTVIFKASKKPDLWENRHVERLHPHYGAEFLTLYSETSEDNPGRGDEVTVIPYIGIWTGNVAIERNNNVEKKYIAYDAYSFAWVNARQEGKYSEAFNSFISEFKNK